MTDKKLERLSPREKAAAHPKSVKLAVAAYCYHVCNGEESDNSHKVKVLVKECVQENCPLWPHRSWRKITGGNVGKNHWRAKSPNTP
jgi:hypothetical protein